MSRKPHPRKARAAPVGMMGGAHAQLRCPRPRDTHSNGRLVTRRRTNNYSGTVTTDSPMSDEELVEGADPLLSSENR